MKAQCHQKPKFDGRQFLDLKLAQEIVAKRQIEDPGAQSMAELTAFPRIDPEAIRYLGQFHYTWVDFAITYMGKALAQEIAAWPAQIMCFKDGMETTSEALVCFRLCPAALRFGNLSDALDRDATKALSTCGGALELAVDDPEWSAKSQAQRPCPFSGQSSGSANPGSGQGTSFCFSAVWLGGNGGKLHHSFCRRRTPPDEYPDDCSGSHAFRI